MKTGSGPVASDSDSAAAPARSRTIFAAVGVLQQNRLFCYVVDARRWLLCGAISNCGNLRSWVRRTLNLGDGADLDRRLARLAPDAHGLTMLPFLAGERAPFWPLDATGAVFGLRSATKPEEIARAAFDAVCYQLAMIHARLRSSVRPARRIVASGGGTGSRWWMQMMADTMDVPVDLSSAVEASSRGAALLAFRALGVHGDEPQPPPASSATLWPNRRRGAVYRRALARYEQYCRQWSL